MIPQADFVRTRLVRLDDYCPLRQGLLTIFAIWNTVSMSRISKTRLFAIASNESPSCNRSQFGITAVWGLNSTGTIIHLSQLCSASYISPPWPVFCCLALTTLSLLTLPPASISKNLRSNTSRLRMHRAMTSYQLRLKSQSDYQISQLGYKVPRWRPSYVWHNDRMERRSSTSLISQEYRSSFKTLIPSKHHGNCLSNASSLLAYTSTVWAFFLAPWLFLTTHLHLVLAPALTCTGFAEMVAPSLQTFNRDVQSWAHLAVVSRICAFGEVI